MLNEERIKLMARMAIYEEHEGKKMIPIGNYFRHDYVSFQVLKAVISATVAFGLILLVYIYYDMERFLQDIYKMDDVLSLGKTVLVLYLLLAGIYGVASYFYYSYRYNHARHSLKNYQADLRRLAAMYERENRK